MGRGRERINPELIGRASRGDAAAARALVELLADRAYRYARSKGLSHESSEDIVQESFRRLFEALPKYREAGRFEAWYFRIVLNLIVDEGRRLTAGPRMEGGTPLESIAAPTGRRGGADDEVPPATLDRLLRGLEPEDQEVLHLRYGAGLRFDQIAQVLGEKENTVLARTHRALKKLRRELGLAEGEGDRSDG